ncbi:MAG TPA: tetratricopeptide repeat protein [Burkholderiales bacterium]|nr:tetratricopeptide repeat protein [Burkholderiales bacterium]
MKKRRKRPERAPETSGQRLTPRPLPVTCLCFALAAALYWTSLRHPLMFDDNLLREDFLRFYGTSWFHFDLRWLPYASFGWTYDVFGKQWFWHRLLNVIFHASTAALLFSFLTRLFEAIPASPTAHMRLAPRWVALFGALIFLLHPVAVYGVAYLVQRPVLLATLFGVLSLRLFLEGLIRHSRSWHYAAAAAYFAAAFSKEHAIMLPAVAVALAVLVRGSPSPMGRLARELAIPFALFALIGTVVVLRAKGLLGAPYERWAPELLSQMRDSPGTPAASDAYLLSVANQGFLFFRYLVTWLIPLPAWMSIDVRTPFPSQLLSWPQLAGFIAWLAFPVAGFKLLRRGGTPGLFGFGLLYPWLLALPEVAVIRVQEPYVLYRSYLWMGGLACVLPALAERVPAKWAFGALCAACLALVPVAIGRIDSFSTSIKLWDDAVRKNSDMSAPFVERAYHNRGFFYLQAGQYLEAQRDFDKAITLNPRDPDAYLGRGTLFARTGSYDQAFADLGRAIELDPGYAEAYNKRCFTKMLIDRPDDALPDCEKAVSLNPRHRDAFTNLGVVYGALNRPKEAEASYRRALEIEPSNADANFNYGVLLAVLGRRHEARGPLAIACNARIVEACKLQAALRRPG